MSRRKQDSVGFIQNAQEHTVNACLCTSLKQHLEVSLKCSSTKAWEDGEKGNWGLPKITQLHNYLQKELGKKKKREEMIKYQGMKRFGWGKIGYIPYYRRRISLGNKY